ncbi:hypothetical protein HK102_001027, partial [Quaeritorhiza haematococci]
MDASSGSAANGGGGQGGSSGWAKDMEHSLEAAVNLASKEFMKGFIAGQIILCILFFFLLKVFLLRNGEETRIEIAKKRRERKLFEPKAIAKYRNDPGFNHRVVRILDE